MFAPARICVPVPLMVRATVPLPFWITPLKVVGEPVGATVNNTEVDNKLLVIVPPLPSVESESEATLLAAAV